jgi:hypothetical protein
MKRDFFIVKNWATRDEGSDKNGPFLKNLLTDNPRIVIFEFANAIENDIIAASNIIPCNSV